MICQSTAYCIVLVTNNQPIRKGKCHPTLFYLLLSWFLNAKETPLLLLTSLTSPLTLSLILCKHHRQHKNKAKNGKQCLWNETGIVTLLSRPFGQGTGSEKILKSKSLDRGGVHWAKLGTQSLPDWRLLSHLRSFVSLFLLPHANLTEVWGKVVEKSCFWPGLSATFQTSFAIFRSIPGPSEAEEFLQIASTRILDSVATFLIWHKEGIS